MAVLRTALLLLLATSLAGCSIDLPFTSQVTVNRRYGLDEIPILVDPSLTPRTNDVSPDRGLFRPKTDQRIVIDYEGPLKLVPATPEDIEAMQAGRQQSPGDKGP